MFTQSLHLKRCSSLPLFCFGVSSPQYMHAFSLLIASDFSGLFKVDGLEVTELVLVEDPAPPRMEGDKEALFWRATCPERGLEELDKAAFEARGNADWEYPPLDSDPFLLRDGWSCSDGSNIFFDFCWKITLFKIWLQVTVESFIYNLSLECHRKLLTKQIQY